MAKNHEINKYFLDKCHDHSFMSRTAIMTTSKFKMHWFLLCLARYSAAQKALEPCEPNYTRNTRLYVYFEYGYTAYDALPP